MTSLLAVALAACTGTSSRPGIYVAPVAGGAPGWIGEPGGAPIFSPVADVVAWGSEDGIALRSLDGSNASSLTDRPVSGRVAWSPDGRSIAFVDRSAATLIVIGAASGVITLEEPVRNRDVATGPASLPILGGPAWSPDGTRLAFDCWDGRGDELCIIGADGNGRRQMTSIGATQTGGGVDELNLTPASSNVGSAVWSPDGSALAVAAYAERRGAPSGVFIIDIDRNSARRISTLQPNSEISWYPDGRSLIFSATQKGRSDVVRVSLGSESPIVVTEGLTNGARDPALSSDGSSLAVSSNDSLVILTGDVAGTAIQTPGLSDRLPDWSHDDGTVVFSARLDPLEIYD